MILSQSLDASLLQNTIESVSSTTWRLRSPNERTILTIIQKYGVPEIIARCLVNRGVALDAVEHFLQPSIKHLLPDPFHLKDMDKAANRIAEAVINNEKIAIFGDYDVDGATSSALLKRFFKMLGNDALVYIPDRIKEGYGPNSKALLALKEQGVGLCITVDCGTLAFEPLQTAADAGLDVIVLDHHLSAENLPQAVAIVNPNRLDENSPVTYLAAVGMCFFTAVAVNNVLKKRGWYQQNNISPPDLLSLLDLVALGTVCDVVPLIGVNRAFVAQGLKILRQRKNNGLNALSDVAAIETAPSAYHLGFVLGPRINAGGRVGQSDLGATLLATSDVDDAFYIAQTLDHYNAERKALEQQVLEEAIAQVEVQDTAQALLFAVGKGWHPGVIGIVASRLKDEYHRPVAVISIENGIGKASARSISGVDFGASIVAANQSGLLIAGGGHAMAAGFTVEESKIETLHAFLSQRFSKGVEEHGARSLKLDGSMSIASITVELVQKLQRLEPFGTSNAEPRFMFPDVYIIKADVVGKDHVRVIVGDAKAGGTGSSIKAMAFRSLETPLGQTLINGKGKNLSLAGRIRLNSWQGRHTPELLIDDVAYGTS